MPLSEKELETFLWEQPAACAQRGLHINHNFFGFGRRYQRLALGPYGVAPLVNVRYWPPESTYYVQVLVFTKAALTTTLYQQAKRYQTALRDALRQALRADGTTATIVPSCVLIGQSIQVTGDFVYALNLDNNCQAFTYTYDVGGLRFEDVGKYWHRSGSEQHPILTEVGVDLLCLREEALGYGDGQAAASGQQAGEPLPQDNLAALVVTAEGVLLNDAQEGAEDYE
jgi:hypothetical protein